MKELIKWGSDGTQLQAVNKLKKENIKKEKPRGQNDKVSLWKVTVLDKLQLSGWPIIL